MWPSSSLHRRVIPALAARSRRSPRTWARPLVAGSRVSSVILRAEVGSRSRLRALQSVRPTLPRSYLGLLSKFHQVILRAWRRRKIASLI